MKTRQRKIFHQIKRKAHSEGEKITEVYGKHQDCNFSCWEPLSPIPVDYLFFFTVVASLKSSRKSKGETFSSILNRSGVREQEKKVYFFSPHPVQGQTLCFERLLIS